MKSKTFYQNIDNRSLIKQNLNKMSQDKILQADEMSQNVMGQNPIWTKGHKK